MSDMLKFIEENMSTEQHEGFRRGLALERLYTALQYAATHDLERCAASLEPVVSTASQGERLVNDVAVSPSGMYTGPNIFDDPTINATPGFEDEELDEVPVVRQPTKHSCPDGGRCHHSCNTHGCWRIDTACLPMGADGWGNVLDRAHDVGFCPATHSRCMRKCSTNSCMVDRDRLQAGQQAQQKQQA